MPGAHRPAVVFLFLEKDVRDFFQCGQARFGDRVFTSLFSGFLRSGFHLAYLSHSRCANCSNGSFTQTKCLVILQDRHRVAGFDRIWFEFQRVFHDLHGFNRVALLLHYRCQVNEFSGSFLFPAQFFVDHRQPGTGDLVAGVDTDDCEVIGDGSFDIPGL